MVEDVEFLNKIKPYNKHNIYTKIYDIDKDGVVKIPNTAKWLVASFEGMKDGCGLFNPTVGGDIITLILDDEENNFFAVMSFLTKEEAVDLAYKLLLHAKFSREPCLERLAEVYGLLECAEKELNDLKSKGEVVTIDSVLEFVKRLKAIVVGEKKENDLDV